MKKLILFCFLLVPLFSVAQSYSINWYKIAGGGGSSTNSQYSLNGTIGQPDAANAMTGGGYAVTGGFWAIVSALQTPGAPPLYITYSTNTVTVFWQNVSGWNLFQNTNLIAPASWSSTSGVTTSNGTNYLNLVSPAGNLFFRLEP